MEVWKLCRVRVNTTTVIIMLPTPGIDEERTTAADRRHSEPAGGGNMGRGAALTLAWA